MSNGPIFQLRPASTGESVTRQENGVIRLNDSEPAVIDHDGRTGVLDVFRDAGCIALDPREQRCNHQDMKSKLVMP